MNRNVSSVCQRQFGKLKGDLPRGSKIGVEGRKCTSATGNASNLRNLPGNFCSDGQSQFVERIRRLNKMPVNRLSHSPYANFAIENDLQGSALWNRQINVLLNVVLESFWTFRCSMLQRRICIRFRRRIARRIQLLRQCPTIAGTQKANRTSQAR